MPIPSAQGPAQPAGDYSEGGQADPDDGLIEPVTVEVPAAVRGERLDKVLASLLPAWSRARLKTWIERERVWVNERAATVRQPVYAGDRVTVAPEPAPEETAFRPEPVPFEVVYESAAVIVIDKRAGLVVHPGSGNWQGTLLNGLLHRYPELTQVPRAGIVHRLDKDTSGLMVVARTLEAQTALVRALQARTVHREYVCAVAGHPPAAGTVEAPIGRDPRAPVRMAIVRGAAGKPAVTHFQVEALGTLAGAPVARVQCRLETGRTHQIRVHMQSIGHPLLGDPLYGDARTRALAGEVPPRQMLHARRLAFIEPGTGRGCEFQAPLPADMQSLFERIQWT